VAVPAFLNPAVLHPPIASTPLPRPGEQDLLGIEIRFALMLERPLGHRHDLFDWLSEEGLPGSLGLDQQEGSDLIAEVSPSEYCPGGR
jgi:hypothetical protein